MVPPERAAACGDDWLGIGGKEDLSVWGGGEAARPSAARACLPACPTQHAPDHLDAVAKDGDKVGRHMRHGRVRIGQQHVVGHLDGAGDDEELRSGRVSAEESDQHTPCSPCGAPV